MNTRVSQFELRQLVESNSSRAERSASQPELASNCPQQPSLVSSKPVFTKSWKLSSSIPYYMIGLLLTATSIAKLWMLLTDSFADIRVGLPKEVLWLSVAFEFWLAYENFRLRDHRVMAFINTIVFASFAIFASTRLAMGYSSCGCSGSLEIPVWIFILMDLAIVVWFVSSASRRNQFNGGLRALVQSWSLWSLEKHGRLAGFGILAALVFALQFRVTAPFRAKIMGESPVISTVKMSGNVGSIQSYDFDHDRLVLNHESFRRVEIRNRSGQDARIIGVAKSCRCFDLVEDPVSKIIPANGLIELPLVIKPKKLGRLRQRLVLFLDHPKQFRMNVDLFGFAKGVVR